MKLSPQAHKQVEEQVRPKRRLRFVRPLLVLSGVIFLVLVFVVSVFVAQQFPEKQVADGNTKVFYDICKEKLKQAKELDVLSDLEANGSSIKVTVGPVFFTVPMDTQREFARTVNCFLVKGADRGVSFDLLHWQTGKKVATWNRDRLDVD